MEEVCELFAQLGLPHLVVRSWLNPPNRRMRTRMSGGVKGANRRMFPLSRLQVEEILFGRRGRAAECLPNAANCSEVLLISVGAGKANAPSSNEELTSRGEPEEDDERPARSRCDGRSVARSRNPDTGSGPRRVKAMPQMPSVQGCRCRPVRAQGSAQEHTTHRPGE